MILGWGNNTYGTVGDSSLVARATPVLATKGAIGTRVISRLLLSYYSVVVLTEDNRLFSWGLNSAGQLGDNTIISKLHHMSLTT